MFQRLGARPQKPAPHHRAEIILARCAAYSASVRNPSLAVFVAVAALCTEAKAKREYTPEEKAARKAAAKEAMLKKTGGIIVKPDTRRGVIAFIDTQSRLSETNIRFVVDALAAKTRYDIRYVKSGQGDPLSLKASAQADIAIIVYLYATERFKEGFVRKNEIFQRDFQSVYDLFDRIDEFFVDAQAMVIEVHLSGESHHSCKYASAQLAAQHGVVLFATNKRSGMEAMSFKTYFAVGAFKFGNFRGNIYRLIVEHHANNIKPRFSVGKTEVARLVHENAQRFGLHGNALKKREWRDANPATHAESFPHIPVTPFRRKKSAQIIPNRCCLGRWRENSIREAA